MISIKYKYIFIHIPKCAGSTIEDALQDDSCILRKNTWPNNLNVTYPLNHLTLDDVEKSKIIFPHFSKYYSFTFTRNPFDRLVSEYFYLKKRLKKLSKDIKKGLIFLSDKNETGISGNHCMQQYKFINDSINYIGRLENLQQDFDTICDEIGIPQIDLPHKNKTKHKHYTEYYDDETRAIVAERYAKDIEYFGYKFGE